MRLVSSILCVLCNQLRGNHREMAGIGGRTGNKSLPFVQLREGRVKSVNAKTAGDLQKVPSSPLPLSHFVICRSARSKVWDPVLATKGAPAPRFHPKNGMDPLLLPPSFSDHSAFFNSEPHPFL